jgi:hypothetical protein
MTSALEIARDYVGRGWNPVPVRFRSKIPLGDEWEKRVIDLSNSASYFNNGPLNIGVLLGATSKGLTDVDLDCAEAVAIAPYLLPPTAAVFGRASKPMSHWLYHTDLASQIDKAELKFAGPDQKTLLELRIGGGGKGAQTVFPGSTHECGEPIAWKEPAGEPAKVDGNLLQRRVQLSARRLPDGPRLARRRGAPHRRAHSGFVPGACRPERGRDCADDRGGHARRRRRGVAGPPARGEGCRQACSRNRPGRRPAEAG